MISISNLPISLINQETIVSIVDKTLLTLALLIIGNLVYRVSDNLISKTFPTKISDHKIGNRSALHWIVDPYQVITHKSSGNAYIVNPVERVTYVSVEKVAIVNELPPI